MISKGHWIWSWPTLELSIHVAPSVAVMLERCRQEQGSHERGGQLFVDIKRPDGLWLVEATPAHPKDKAGPTWLKMNPDRCREEIIAANAKGLRLIGYWHSHPEAVPNLSGQDLKSLKKFSQQNSSQLPNPLAVIVGRSALPDGIRAWIYRNKNSILATRLTPF